MIRWDIAVIGRLTRNKYWGESEQESYHSVLATSTVLKTPHGNILVDPSLEGEHMAQAVFDASGLKPEDISIIFVTHGHFDHWRGLEAFPNAKVYLPGAEKAAIGIMLNYMMGKSVDKNQVQMRLNAFFEAGEELIPGVQVVSLPGHTVGLHGLLFDAPEGRVLISGDAVMSKEFFAAQESYFYGASVETGRETVKRAAKLADIIIPGHGNYFLTAAYPQNPVKQRYPWETEITQSYINQKTPCRFFLDHPEILESLNKMLPSPIANQRLSLGYDVPIGAIAYSQALPQSLIEDVLKTLNCRYSSDV